MFGEKYISDLIELHNTFKTVIKSVTATGVTTAAAACAVEMLKETVESITHKADAAAAAIIRLGNVIHSTYAPDAGERKSNNWLKMHGLPMRRKGKGRKHHE